MGACEADSCHNRENVRAMHLPYCTFPTQDQSEPVAFFSCTRTSLLSSLSSLDWLSASRSTGRAGGGACAWLVALIHV